MVRLFPEKIPFRRLRALRFTKVVIQSKGCIDSMIRLKDRELDLEVIPPIDSNIEGLKADTICGEVVLEVEVLNENVLEIERQTDIEIEK